MTYEPKVTLGNIISGGTVVAGLISSAMIFDHRVTILESKMPLIEKALLSNAVAVENLSAAQAALGRSIDRITIILEEKHKEQK
jgi:hypothetical protein